MVANNGSILQVKWPYKVKINCCLFERILEIKKNGIFRFERSFVAEIFMFLCYANEESDDVISGMVPLKDTSQNQGYL